MHPKESLWFQGLKQGRPMRFRPLGGSMIPWLRQGDTVTVKPGRRYRLGDIILWQQGEAFIMHRVVARSGGGIITKGDALGFLDQVVAPADIWGRAVARERQGKVSCLDSFWARYFGLAFCLTLSWVPRLLPWLAAGRRYGQEKLRRLLVQPSS
jgi:hypothetical protein